MAKAKSLQKSVIYSIIIPIIVVGVIFAALVFFTIEYLSNSNKTYLYICLGLIVLLIFSFLMLCIGIYKRLHKIYYHGIYETSVRNLEALSRDSVDIQNYPDANIDEVNRLNKGVNNLRKKLYGATIYSSEINFDGFNFDFHPEFSNLITIESFKNELDSIILHSSNYRNVVVEFYYRLENEEKITSNEYSHLIKLIKKEFNAYENKLLVFGDGNNNLYLYLPVIDSFSRIKEQILNVINESSVIRKTADGLNGFNVNAVFVSYPYSAPDEIFHDLEYAKRSNEIVYGYLPDRLVSLSNISLRKSSMNLNYISKIIHGLGNLDSQMADPSGFKQTIKENMKSLSTFLGVDEVGIFRINDNIFKYYSDINVTNRAFSVFPEDEFVDERFINAMGSCQDADKSYFFSSRDNVNSSIAKFLDQYDIQSGYFYIIRNARNITGVIYFFNYGKHKFNIDSYLREGVGMFATRIGNFLLAADREVYVSRSFGDMDNILRFCDLYSYRVDKETFKVLYFSPEIKTLFPKIAQGEKCYRALYGLEEPCKKCPLKTSLKMVSEIKKNKYETSLVLNTDKKARFVRLLVKLLKEESAVSYDRFNKDLLINSYPALLEDMTNFYFGKGKGYLLLLRFDNLDKLVEKYGSESTLIAMRGFIKSIKMSNNEINNIYYFNNQTIGMLFSEIGQIDIINRCEKLYDLSQENYFDSDEKDAVFKITYLPLNYPSGYPTANDFLKNSQRFFDSGRYPINNSLIYFLENDYTRSASRKTFMLSVIDEKFKDETFKALFQPYVSAETKHICGAEMLLRITDDYRNIVFNAGELIRVAAANNKIRLISDALINYIGNFYQKQGLSMFKSLGLSRISINLDYSYFVENGALEGLFAIIAKYALPKGFIAFEIPERDIADNEENYAKITPLFKQYNIELIADQYIGKDISVEKLKSLGFSEVKVSRSLVAKVDSDPQKQAILQSMCETAKQFGLKMSFVGVENVNQSDIIKTAMPNAILQGFYFYQPMDKSELVNVLRNYNMNKF